MATATPSTTAPGAGPTRRRDPLGTFGDFLPWILYWVLVGNVPFRTSLLIALATAAVVLAIHRATDGRWRTLPVGSFVVFAVLTVLAFVVSDTFLERWLQPLSNLGLLLVVLAGMAVGRPFTLEYAEDSVSPGMARSDGFRYVNQRITALWAAAFVVMTVSSFVPPIVEGDATIHDGGRWLSIVGYWVVPFVTMGLAALATVLLVRGLGDDGDQGGGDEHRPGPGLEAADDVVDDDGLALDVPDVTPSDEALPVVVRGLAPGDEVEVTVTLADAMNRRFVSTARLEARGDVVDLAVDAPTAGSWDGVDAAGPVWSAEWAEDGTPDLFLPAWGPAPARVEVAVGGRRLARTVQRSGLGDAVAIREVHEPDRGVVARGFLPPGATPADGAASVVIVGGSEGGLDSMSPMAAALATRGVPSIVVALFGAPGLPDELLEVPLEPVLAGANWLREATGGAAGPLALLGLSRGSEAVLSAAAHLDGLEPDLVVGLSPGSVVWEALDEEGVGTGRSSWTVGGQPLPFTPIDDVAVTRDLLRQAPRRAVHRHVPQLMHLRAAYEGGLARPRAELAAIPVERIAGRLVLHAGASDALWPSDAMGAALVRRRRLAGLDADELVVHPGAGHLLRWPLVPTRPDRLGGLLFGGDPASQAEAHTSLAASVLSVLGGRPLAGAGPRATAPSAP